MRKDGLCSTCGDNKTCTFERKTVVLECEEFFVPRAAAKKVKMKREGVKHVVEDSEAAAG